MFQTPKPNGSIGHFSQLTVPTKAKIENESKYQLQVKGDQCEKGPSVIFVGVFQSAGHAFERLNEGDEDDDQRDPSENRV